MKAFLAGWLLGWVYCAAALVAVVLLIQLLAWWCCSQ